MVIIYLKKLFSIPLTEKELWTIVLNNIDLFDTGLCSLLITCNIKGILSDVEVGILREIMHEESLFEQKAYWIGTCGDKGARVEWLKNRIKKL
jgi:hypothetical protein